ncbi:MAG TPA: hypothetical protein VHL80_05170 [Polyangia bacterium]|nr:hypothetical protein [Polyangia bacterium]
MVRSNKDLVVGLALAGLAALAGACSKQGAEPTGFGVNVTVDATGLSTDERKAIITDQLTVVSDKAGDAPVKRVLPDLPKAIQGGTVKFHYTPGASITKSDKLTFGLDVIGAGSKLIASGTSETVPLAANAVEAKIVLISVAGGNDGGPNDGGGNDATDANPGDIVNPGGKANGVACVTDDECGTAFCTDGVCCNERCQEQCATCNGATKGVCTAYAADTDPEFECSPNPDAGTDAGAAEAGTVDGSTDGDQGDGPVINTPDGGLMTTPRLCASTCNGARACKFPDTTRSCGMAFCNTSGEIASFVCDGKGGCGPLLTECQHYKCTDATGACGTSCNGTGDCLSTDFCDGNTLKCVAKKGNGLTCATPDECASNACSGPAGGKVCCNTACDGQGQSCTMAGAVGKCQCQGVTCAAGVACQVFYRDADGDGYGNASGTIALGTAAAGCMGSTPPAGFVADNSDCDDGDANVHPGQTAFFTTASAGLHIWDYDCDKTILKQTPEYPGGMCKFCGPVGGCSAYTLTCNTANQASSFQCPQEFSGIIKFDEPLSTDAPIARPTPTSAAASSSGGAASAGSLAPRAAGVSPIIPIGTQCCGCFANDRTGFLGTVACGVTTNTWTCQPCAAAGQGPAPLVATSKTQACR